MPPLWSVLLGMSLVAVALRERTIALCAVALLFNWITNEAMYLATNDQFSWESMATFDWLTAFFIFWCSTKAMAWRALLVLTYACELIAHVGYGLSLRNDVAQYEYYYALHYLAWAQAAVIVTWGTSDGIRRVCGSHHIGRSLPSRLIGAFGVNGCLAQKGKVDADDL